MSGWITLNRGPDTDALRKDRNAFLLLSLIADRARWRDDPCPVTGLEQGQAMLGKGDCEAIGLTEKNRQQLRSALKRLVRMGFVTTQPTTRGTVVTLTNQSVFSLSPTPPTTPPTTDQPSSNHQVTTDQPSSNHQVTTKKKGRRENGNNQQGKTETPGDDFPHQSTEFRSAWKDWEKHRAEIRKKLTPTTRSKQLTQLEKLTEAKAIETIERSIAAGWTGLFEDKSTSSRPSGNQPCQSLDNLLNGKSANIINASELNLEDPSSHD